MSDNTINHSSASLKHINTRLEKLGRLADRLDVLAYRYQRVSMCCRELSKRYATLAQVLDQVDCVAFEIRQEYTLLMEKWRAVNQR
ncbi:MAG: hypothetical protein H0X26_05570 [Alphaproteobacteria bacterium]|nr:hypothetical protein [Alphaproteobacteria bacterium]